MNKQTNAMETKQKLNTSKKREINTTIDVFQGNIEHANRITHKQNRCIANDQGKNCFNLSVRRKKKQYSQCMQQLRAFVMESVVIRFHCDNMAKNK